MSDVATAVRSFINLRAFAGGADIPPGGDWLTARTALALPDGPVTIALLALDGGAGQAPALQGDE